MTVMIIYSYIRIIILQFNDEFKPGNLKNWSKPQKYFFLIPPLIFNIYCWYIFWTGSYICFCCRWCSICFSWCTLVIFFVIFLYVNVVFWMTCVLSVDASSSKSSGTDHNVNLGVFTGIANTPLANRGPWFSEPSCTPSFTIIKNYEYGNNFRLKLNTIRYEKKQNKKLREERDLKRQ